MFFDRLSAWVADLVNIYLLWTGHSPLRLLAIYESFLSFSEGTVEASERYSWIELIYFYLFLAT